MIEKFIVLDTETTNDIDCPLTYDLGFAVIDKNGKVYGKISFRTITNIRDYINSSDNSENFWKKMIRQEMVISAEREQS